MDRKEAIEILKAAQTDDFPYLPGKLTEAVDLAIKSLETDEAYQIMYEGGEIFTKDDVVAMFDKIRAEIAELSHYYPMGRDYQIAITRCLAVIDKYKAESDPQEGSDKK